MHIFTLLPFWGVFIKAEKKNQIRHLPEFCFLFAASVLQSQWLREMFAINLIASNINAGKHFQKTAYLKHLHHGERNGLVTCCAIIDFVYFIVFIFILFAIIYYFALFGNCINKQY